MEKPSEKTVSRRVCPGCKEQLALTAYYRHQRGNCPGRQLESQALTHWGSDSSLDEEVERGLDSSFCFSDSECLSPESVADQLVHDDSAEIDEMLDQESSSSEDQCSLSDEEIWDSSDTSDEDRVAAENTRTSNIVVGICLFLNFFQLFYKVSERGILALILFLRSLLSFLGLNDIISSLPKSLSSIRCILRKGTHHSTVLEYVVCPKCHSLYFLEDCIIRHNGKLESKLCHFVQFPRHTQLARRSKCNTPLLKTISVGKGSKLVPRKTFVYNSVISSLAAMVSRKGFMQKCEHWRDRTNLLPSDTLADIYEGRVWKETSFISGRPFLSQPNNLSLMLNVDWFNPYDETPYSAGVMYFVILNLPRSERYKFENIILAGVIPGPREPKKHINTYLSPIVKDLKQLYVGVAMANPNSFCGTILVRAILSCVSCDLPATRKVCGFYSFSSLYGCSKCLKQFVTTCFGSKPDYSGFDFRLWQPRNLEIHRTKAFSASMAVTASAQLQIEQSLGVRYSVLLDLPYFDVIRHHVVDPMHALFLGIAKHTMKIWRDLNIITPDDLSVMQEKVDNMTPPPKVGRIPRKIQSGFMAFTADEWKNWILLYSPYILYGLIPERDFKCWCYFVEACQLICQPIITKEQVLHAHGCILKFCCTYEELYGKEMCTPNMHMACHLNDIMLDYGPVHGYWCFSFERYNGMLESMKKSWVNPEKQLLFKFLDLQIVNAIDVTSDNDFFSLVSKDIALLRNISTGRTSGSVRQMAYESHDLSQQLMSKSGPTSFVDPEEKNYHEIIQPFFEKCFTDDELKHIGHVYKAVYPNHNITHISRFYKEFKTIIINGEEYISVKSRSQRSSAIFAYWPSLRGDIDTTGNAPYQIGNVQSFIRHHVTLENDEGCQTITTTLLALIKWYEDHPRRDHFTSSVIVCGTLFRPMSNASFIPVSRFLGRCTTLKTRYQFEYGQDCIIIAIPCPSFIAMS